MTLSKIQIAFFALLILAAGFGMGLGVASTSSTASNADDETDFAADIVAEHERDVDRLEQEFDAAMSDLNSGTPPPTYRTDPQIQMGQRHAVELNEQICRQTGQNCEFAAMARRQYEERYGPM